MIAIRSKISTLIGTGTTAVPRTPIEIGRVISSEAALDNMIIGVPTGMSRETGPTSTGTLYRLILLPERLVIMWLLLGWQRQPWCSLSRHNKIWVD